MSLDPLLSEGFAVAAHAVAALAALVIGAIQLAAPKGTVPHRALGWVWVVLMLWIAIGSFWIAELRLWGRWSPIHLLSLLVIAMVPLAVWRARRGRIEAHRRGMIALYTLALVGAGVFTLWPGRVMHAVVFGG